MPALDATVAAVLSGPGPYPWLCDIVFPGSGSIESRTWHVAKVGFALPHEIASQGKQYRPLVTDYQYPRYGASDSGGTVAGVEMAITIDDNSRELVALVEGSYSDQVDGGAVTVTQGHETLAVADFPPIFSGLIIGIDWEGTEAIIRCRTDDAALKHTCPKPYARITVDSFPKADPAAWGTIARPIYGIHDSAGYTDKGLINCLSVDRTAYMYMLSIGRCMDITAVFINEIRLTITTHYTWAYLNRRGVWYTVIYITATGYDFIFGAAWSGGSAAEKLVLSNGARITADVLGFETTGYGPSGTGSQLILNPIDQIVHYLSNFVFGDWRRGPWLSNSTRIGDATLGTTLATVQDFFESRSYKGAHVVSIAAAGSSQLASWLQSMEAVAWWGPDGLLNFGVDDFTDTDTYPDGLTSVEEKLVLAKSGDRQMISKTTANFVRDDNGGQYLATTTVQDPDAIVEAADEINQEWGSSS